MPDSPKADVLILTKNGGPLFRRVLPAVLAQRTPWPFTVCVWDSGSTDGTLEFSRSLPVRVETLAPGDFQHGRTRNLAMSRASGEFGVFLTQDALPVDDQWLLRLVTACEAAPDRAGAFGRHHPYPGTNPFLTRDLIGFFDHLARTPAERRVTDADRYARDPAYRQSLHFFSDCNSCLRRSVWRDHPFPEVDFAEDQAWADRVLRAGYATVYADSAAVFHGHDFGVGDTYRRSAAESAAYRALFGYALCPTLRVGLTAWLRMTASDARYALRHRLWWRAPRWTLKMPALIGARLAGYYVGGRASTYFRAAQK